ETAGCLRSCLTQFLYSNWQRAILTTMGSFRFPPLTSDRCTRSESVSDRWSIMQALEKNLKIHFSFSPGDSVKQGSQFEAASGVDHLNIGNAAKQMAAEVTMARVILAGGAMAHAVGQDRFQLVIDRTADVESVVHHDATQLLAHALSHESAFLKMDLEAFLRGD